MAVIVGAFLGGPDTTLEAGTASISLSIMTRDRMNLDTASWTITAPGFSRTVQADASGRGYIVVPSGKTYTVTLAHQGNYANDGPQTVITESKMNYGVLFDLADYDTITTTIRVYTKPNADVTATEQGGPGFFEMNGGPNGVADFKGLPPGSTWEIQSGKSKEIVLIDKVFIEVDMAVYIYGVRINKAQSNPYTRVEYTDDAIGIQPASGHSLGGWANTKLFQGIKPVVRNDYTGEFKDLNKRNLKVCTDGSNSNIVSARGCDAFTEFPTWWIYESSDSTYKYIKFSNKQINNKYHAMYAMDNGVLRNCFHVGCFDASNNLDPDKCFSLLQRPTVNKSIQDFISMCQKRGESFDIFSWYAWNYIASLFILAYKTCDSQSVFRGYVNGSGVESNYPTSFDNDFGLAGSSNGKEQMSFLWITNLWGNVYQFIGGAKTNGSNQLMVIPDGNKCTVNDSDFTTVGSGGQTSGFSGYISEMDLSSSKVGFFPKATSGSSTTHWCDYGYVYPSYFPYVGGNYGDGDGAGLFSVLFNYSASDTASDIGSRLMYKGGR